MPFVKGVCANKKGRGKGTPNFASIEKRQLIEFLKEEGAQRFIQELMTLQGKDYCQAYIPVIEVAFPKLSRTVLEGPNEGPIQQKLEIEFVNGLN